VSFASAWRKNINTQIYLINSRIHSSLFPEKETHIFV
jgi:hypothetical protein